jgi:hypothetical protein
MIGEVGDAIRLHQARGATPRSQALSATGFPADRILFEASSNGAAE